MNGNFQSMDATALLLVGMLLEESAQEVLGDAGDMVFVEGAREDDDGNEEMVRPRSVRRKSTSAAARKSGKTRARKRRKLDLDVKNELVLQAQREESNTQVD